MPSTRREFIQDLSLLAAGGLVPGATAATASAAESSPADDVRAGKTSVPGHSDQIKLDYDLIVVGGGIAGVSAAISAARNGVKVALVHERSMLGGNSSSEVRLYPEHNDAHQPWIKEGGINNELHVEERTRNHIPYREGLMNCHWDLVLYEWVVREKNIALYLNTHMHRAIMKDKTHIAGIVAIQLGTEKDFILSAPLFVDATGDGVLAYRAGADFRWGREATTEYNEPLAPPQADEKVMGNTLFFRAVDTGQPVPFKLPDWAVSFPQESDLTSRGHQYFEAGYWWIEVGAPYHPIKDNNEIRHEALRQLLGVWDHIKNRGDHGAANYSLDFVGFWPYKRESRRVLGDYVITQQHVQDPAKLDDTVAYGAWGIDIHTQGGILTRGHEPYPSPHSDKNWDNYGSQVYGIPLRSLYSRNVENLMMAGRPISCSYVAFASSRVLSTGSIVGQAAGAAAAVCKRHATTPRVVAREHAKECQQLILRQDGHIPGVVNEDPDDLARQAQVIASSDAALLFPDPDGQVELKFPHAQLFPVSGKRVDRVELLLRSKLASSVELQVGLRPAAHAWDFRSTDTLAEARGRVPARSEGWVAFDLKSSVESNKLYYVHIEAKPGVFWKQSKDIDGQPNRCPVATTPANRPGIKRWRPLTGGRCLIMRITPESRPYAGENVIRGTNRPDMWSNIWISDTSKGLPAWLELRWPQPRKFNTLQLTFDTDANRRVTLPLFRYPHCVKDYVAEYGSGGTWKPLVTVTDNYQRQRVHRFDAVESDRLRLNILATNGAPSARIYEARVYNRDEG